MNWTKIRNFYGLERPFKFSVAIPFLLNVCTLIAFLLVCLVLFGTGGLSIKTARFYFVAYIACLLLVAATISKAGKLAYLILGWCIVELGLAVGSASLRPQNAVVYPWPGDYAFIYHPLLQIVPRANWEYKDQLDFGGVEDKAKAAGIDVAALQGKELVFHHNSLGLRGKELTAGDLRKDLIFVYGGSTTYDVGITQGETWVEQLQAGLNGRYTILNFGIVGHSSAEHLIQTAFYQGIVEKKPVCALYYAGWNEIINAHIENLDNAYADYHLLTTAVRRTDLSIAKYSPLFLLVNDLARKRFDSIPLHPNILGRPAVAGDDKRLEAIFAEHVRTIAAINGSRGIRTVFIGQMLNKDWPQPPNVYAPLVRTEDFFPLVQRLNAVLSATAAGIPAKYIDPGITNFGHGDFVDLGHFTTSGAKKFAGLISRDVDGYCR